MYMNCLNTFTTGNVALRHFKISTSTSHNDLYITPDEAASDCAPSVEVPAITMLSKQADCEALLGMGDRPLKIIQISLSNQLILLVDRTDKHTNWR